MASLNFEESIVLILFAQAIGKNNPTRAELEQFDLDLQDAFGQDLTDILLEEGMASDIHNRSAVLGCRPHVGGGTASAQIRRACRYVLHAQQELGAHAIAAFHAAAAPAAGRKSAKARRKTARKGARARTAAKPSKRAAETK